MQNRPCIHPALVAWVRIERNFFATMRPTLLIKRFASVDEVANIIAYIASPLASATNDAALRVDGGLIRSII